MNLTLQNPHQPSQHATLPSVNRQNIAATNPNRAGPATDTVTLSTGFRTGKENILSLGALALGGQDQIQSWSEKGLEISNNTIERAYEFFNQGFKESLQNRDQTSLIMNWYDIVASSQVVPDWFQQEKNMFIESIADPTLKDSFESGDFYHITSPPSGPNTRPLETYNVIAKW